MIIKSFRTKDLPASGNVQSDLPMWSPLLSSHLYLKVTFSCPVIESFIWMECLLRGLLFYKATFSLSPMWPLYTGLTVFILYVYTAMLCMLKIVKFTCKKSKTLDLLFEFHLYCIPHSTSVLLIYIGSKCTDCSVMSNNHTYFNYLYYVEKL